MKDNFIKSKNVEVTLKFQKILLNILLYIHPYTIDCFDHICDNPDWLISSCALKLQEYFK